MLLLAGGFPLLACRTPESPSGNVAAGAGVVIVAGAESGRFAAVDGHRGRVTARSGPVPRHQDAYALSPDRATLYVTAFDDASGRQLLALDAQTLKVRWREPLSTALDQRRARFGGLAVYGESGLGVSPDGSRLIVASAYRDGTEGLAVLDARTRDAVGFVGPLAVRGGVATLPAGPAAPSGAVLVVGRREQAARATLDWLFVLDPATLTVRDSATMAPLGATAAPALGAPTPAPDGRHVYLAGADRLYKYDLVDRRVVASAPSPSYGGQLAVAPNGQAVYKADPGVGFERPGSGLLFVFGPNLEPHDPVDLRPASAGGVPPTTRGVGVSSDGRLVYVSAGTSSRGPVYGPQPAQLLVVDAAARRLIRAVALDDWSPGPVFVQ